MLTWGLLGPGKGIERVIKALPSLRDLVPRPHYLVVGETHPKVLERDGEAYRAGLVARARALGVADMVTFNRPSAKTHSGVWRDLAIRKRRTEVDVQIAPIVEIGKTHGIPCPSVTALVDMIHEIEAGKRQLSDDNLLELAKTAKA